jgi:hypothetical protein
MRFRPALCLAGLVVLGGCVPNTHPMPATDPGPGRSSYLLPGYGEAQGRQKSPGLLEWDREYKARYRQRGLTDRQAAAEEVVLGLRALERGQNSEAMRHFNLGWLSDPESAAPYHGFALVLAARGSPPQEVLTQFEAARGRAGATPEILISEARYLDGIGRRREAFDLLIDGLAESPRAHNLARMLETLSIEAGDPVGVCRWGTRAIQNGDDQPSTADFMATACGTTE